MRTIERTIDIAAAPEAVFAFLHDPDQQPRWRASLTEWRQEPPGTIGPGTRFHGVSRVAGRAISSDYEVVDFEAGRHSPRLKALLEQPSGVARPAARV